MVTVNSKKTIRLDCQKKKSSHVHHDCLYISQPLLHDRDMKLPNFTRPLFGVGEHNTKIFFSFSKLTYGPFGFNPENFANIWQIKWNWLRSMKFETVRIHFLSDVLVCCHPQILLTWQRDVTTSPLYCEWFKFCPPFFKEIWKKGTRSHSPTTFVEQAVYYRKSGEATSFFLS